MKQALEFYLKLEPRATKTGNILFNKTKKSNRAFKTLPVYEDIDWKAVEKLPGDVLQNVMPFLNSDDPIKNADCFLLLKQILEKREEKLRQEKIRECLSDAPFNIYDLKIIQPLNISSDYRFAQSHIWDTHKNCLLGPEMITPEGLEKYLRSALEDRDTATQFLNKMFLPATTVFDPTQDFGFQVETETPLPIFNVACPQPWKALKPSGVQPELFIEFINFFIPEDKEREEVLQWLYTAAFYKNYYALVLCGVKGTGKGIFSTLAKKVAAGSYLEAFDAPESMGSSSHFNSSLLNARLCVFDEITINFKNKDRLKRLMNDFATLEGKGVDAQKNVKLWANFIISNNFPLDNNLEWDDRRFLVPELTKTKIEKEWGVDKIDELVLKIEQDPQFICDVVHYIKSEIKYFRAKTNPLRTQLFYKIVYFSLTPWQKSLLEFPSKTSDDRGLEGYPLLEIRNFHKLQFKSSDDQDSSKRFAQNQTVSQFLENYRHGKDQIKVATFKTTPNKESKIIYTKEFLNLKGELV